MKNFLNYFFLVLVLAILAAVLAIIAVNFAYAGNPRQESSQNFYFNVAKGKITAHSAVHKFGTSESVTTNYSTVFGNGGTLYTYLTTPTILQISSDSSADVSGDTGLTTVTVYGLDSNYDETEDTVTLNGLNQVATTSIFFRVFRMIGRTAESGGVNVGTIYTGTGTAVDGVPPNIYALIPDGTNQSLMSLYTIPRGKTGYLIYAHAASPKSKAITFQLMMRPFGEVFQTKGHIDLFESDYFRPYIVPPAIPAKTDIEIRVKSDAGGTAHISAEFDLILVDD